MTINRNKKKRNFIFIKKKQKKMINKVVFCGRKKSKRVKNRFSFM